MSFFSALYFVFKFCILHGQPVYPQLRLPMMEYQGLYPSYNDERTQRQNYAIAPYSSNTKINRNADGIFIIITYFAGSIIFPTKFQTISLNRPLHRHYRWLLHSLRQILLTIFQPQSPIQTKLPSTLNYK